MEIKERFIILRKMKYSEADLIIHALSVHGEKLSFIARGALKSKKRFGGGILEPSHFVQFTYKQTNEAGRIHTLNEAVLLNDFKNIRQNYDRLDFALHVLECVARVSQEGDKNSEDLFNLLGNTLKAIETSQDVTVLKMHFYLKFLLQQGVLTAESWMTPFLKTNMTESNSLLEEKSLRKDVQSHLSMMESVTRQYMQTAEHH